VTLWWAARGALSLLLVVLLRPPSVLAQAGDSTSTIDAYEAARNRGDWDGVLALFADNAVVTDSTGGVHTGKDEIRRMMVIQMGGNRGRYAAISERHTSGNQVSWVERVATPTSRFSYIVEATVQEGRITALAYASSGSLLRAPAAVERDDRLPAPLSLGVVLLVLAGTLVGLSLPPRRARQSPLRGSLLSDLRRWSEARQHPVA